MLAALASEAVNKVVPLLTMHFAALHLGVAGFGISQFSMWLLEWGIISVAFGYSQALPVALRRANSDQEKRQLTGALLVNRVGHAALGCLLLTLIVRLNPAYGVYWPAVGTSLFILLLSALDLSGGLIAVQRIWQYSALMIIAKLASLLAVWRFIQTTTDAALYVGLTNAANGGICIGTFILGWIFIGFSRPSYSQMRHMFLLSVPFALSGIMLLCVERFDLFLVERGIGPEGAGFYSGPAKLLQSLIPLITSISSVFYSEMIGIHEEESLKKHLRFSLLSVMIFVLPLIVGTWFTGGEILKLVFGPGFELQSKTLSILILNSFAHAVILMIGFQTIGLRHKMRPVYVALLIGLVAGMVAGPYLVQKYGYVGAAIGSVTSRWISAAAILWFAQRAGLLRMREITVPVIQAGIPAVGMGIILAGAERLGAESLTVLLGLGAGSYAVLFLLFNRRDAQKIFRKFVPGP